MQSQPKSKKPSDEPAPEAPGRRSRPDEPAPQAPGRRSRPDEPAPEAPGRRSRTEPTAAERAMRLLARREHTRRELETKLGRYVEDSAEIQRVLDDFTARGWLSEARAAAQLVRLKRGRFGAARIRQVLADKGVPQALIASSLETLKESELDTARSVWARKFKTPPASPADRARHVRFLQSRGFSLDLAMRVVRGGGPGDAGDS